VALGVFVSGAYSATFDNLSLGLTREGYKLTFSPKGKQINRSDMCGGSLIEVIQDGCDWGLQCDSLEYRPGTLATWTQFQTTLGLLSSIGTSSAQNAVPLVMTVTAGTEAALNGSAINTLTAINAILAPNSDLSLMFDSTLREMPIKLVLLPDLTSKPVRHFSTT
jgi:hypothetical protein